MALGPEDHEDDYASLFRLEGLCLFRKVGHVLVEVVQHLQLVSLLIEELDQADEYTLLHVVELRFAGLYLVAFLKEGLQNLYSFPMPVRLHLNLFHCLFVLDDEDHFIERFQL